MDETAPVRSGSLLPAAALALALMLPAVAQSAPQVTLEFESAFGEFGFYTPSFPANSIPPTGFSAPTGLDFFDAERLIIADRGNNKLQVCDLDGECRWLGNDGLGGLRNSAGVFDRPHGVEVGIDGLIAIADEDNHAVQRCDEFGTCRYSGDTATEDNRCRSSLGRWCLPQDVVFDGNTILGLDTGNNRIQVLRLSDLFVLRVISLPEGSGAGEFQQPRGMALGPDGRLVIADTGNSRIQVCDILSNQLDCSAFGGPGSRTGRFSSPVGIDVDAQGLIWVADTGNHRIQVCDADGACQAFGEPGTGPGQFDAPHDLAVHALGRVAVVDTNNNRIQLFRTEATGVAINAGMSDAWGSTETPGQGFFLTVLPNLRAMFLAHFTFDTARPADGVDAVLGDPGQRWVTALGPYSGNRAELEAELTFGGVFDALVPEPEQSAGYGRYTIEFADCMNALIRFEYTDAGLSGEIPIRRLTPDNAALCEALREQ